MMYDSKFVVAIKAGGKILRETKDLVHLPFGSEFSVLVKNLNSRRAKFTLHIDGTDVLDGEEIIVNANSEVEMKRFIRNGNMNEGNAFKFIERTAAIEDGPRGVKMDDGVVRVEFWFEKQPDQVITTTHHHRDIWWDDYNRRSFWKPPFGGPYYGTGYAANQNVSDSFEGSLRGGTTKSATLRSMASASNVVAQGMNSAVPLSSANTVSASTDATLNNVISTNANEVGITVPGSKVEQKFHSVYGFVAEAVSNVIVIRIAGKVGEASVSIPITVKAKNICSTCSHTNKSSAKFCSQCGTALELL
jgi:hypothetical protein